MLTVQQGQPAWVPDATEAYKKTLIYDVGESVIKTEDGEFARSDVYPVNPDTQEGVPDNTQVRLPLSFLLLNFTFSSCTCMTLTFCTIFGFDTSEMKYIHIRHISLLPSTLTSNYQSMVQK